MSDFLSYLRLHWLTVDFLLGVSIMGITGGVIGLNLGGPLVIGTGIFLGVVLGGFVSTFGARVFFVSILSGTVIGGVLALVIGGPGTLTIGAGTGGAAGGFIGINIELFRKGSSRTNP